MNTSPLSLSSPSPEPSRVTLHIDMTLKEFLCHFLGCGPGKEKARFEWAVGPVSDKTKGEGNTMDITLTNEQKVKVTLAPVTATGKPAKLDGEPTWTVQSGDSTVQVDPGGLSAFLVSSDTPGDTVIVVEADANLGEGVETISDAIRLTVEGARASSLGLVVGTPEPKG